MKPRRLVPALVVLALCGSAFAAVALAGNDPTLKGAKKKAGPYADGLISVNVSERPRNVYVKVISTSTDLEELVLSENSYGDTKDFTFKWFRGDNDISQDVQTEGYGFNLKPDKPKIFRLRIKPVVPTPGDVCVFPDVDDGGGPDYGVYFGVNGNLCI